MSWVAPASAVRPARPRNSGTEATDVCIRFARVATRRRRFLFLEGSFHGRSYGAISLCGWPQMKEFQDALGELGVQNDVVTFTASDFGRTLTSNGQGSDHAWGGNHMVMGGPVRGSRIYGDFPSLYEDNPLDTGRGRLIPTTSCDEYFAELALWFGVAPGDLSAVFPNIGRFYDTTSDETPLNMLADLSEQVFLPLITR